MGAVRSLLIPGSLTVETADPKLATYKVGLVGRAAAIFRVDEVVVFEDPDHKDSRLVSQVLRYQATAPYLRKRLFPLSDELAHAGVLPPLNLPAHLVPHGAEAGQVRMGSLVGNQVEIGLGRPAELQLRDGEVLPEPGIQFPVEVKTVRAGTAYVNLHDPAPDEYLGFEVARAPSLRVALKDRGPYIGTSRDGEPFSKKHLAPEGIALLFGSPDKGVEELLGESPRFPMVNTIPDQGTKTVRTEEAILASLGLIHGVACGLPVD